MSINLKWVPRVTAATQEIYRSENPFNENSLPAALATIGASDTDYIDGTTSAGVFYYYAIAAVSGSRIALSSVVGVLETGDLSPPAT
jgi:hypothetical protein